MESCQKSLTNEEPWRLIFRSRALPLHSSALYSLMTDMTAPLRHHGTTGSCLYSSSSLAESARERSVAGDSPSVEPMLLTSAFALALALPVAEAAAAAAAAAGADASAAMQRCVSCIASVPEAVAPNDSTADARRSAAPEAVRRAKVRPISRSCRQFAQNRTPSDPFLLPAWAASLRCE